MKARVTVGPVDVRTDGMDLSTRDVRSLMRFAASIALSVIEAANDSPSEESPANPVGFTAMMERAPDFAEDRLEDEDDE